MNKSSIGANISVGDNEPLLVVAGPCQIESRDHALRTAEEIVKICEGLPINLVYKSSFDKANRTSLSGARGVGMDEGLKILSEVRETFKIPVQTDIHGAEQVEAVSSSVDVLQIPAFLCRQTDLLIHAGKSGKAIAVKKGQFMHPKDMEHVAAKVASSGNSNILLYERGTCFGYRDLVMDPRALVMMRETGYPVVFDATHSVANMGGNKGSSGGSREYVEPLAKAAVAVGVDGVFFECHEDPNNAPSDGPCMLHLDSVANFLARLLAIREASR